jgi:hypothetical protein
LNINGYSRGYIDKSKRGNNYFTWTCINSDNSQKLLKIISNCFNCSTLHKPKGVDEKFEYVQIVDNNVNEILNDAFISNKTFNDWIYSASYSFLNGLIYGIFFTNGTFSFNKAKTKAYITIKFLNHSLAERFTDLLNLRYCICGTLSLVPDKKFCKVSYRLNKSFFRIIENGFIYGYITNPFKEALLKEVKEIIELDNFDNSDFTDYQFKLEKSSIATGYNFRINGAKGFSLLSGVLIPSL